MHMGIIELSGVNMVRPDFDKYFQNIEHYTVKIAATVIFVAWIASSVWHELSRIFISLTSP
jgi:hypothetical protein